MRQERTVQASIIDLFASHEIGCELKAMSDWLDEHRDRLGGARPAAAPRRRRRCGAPVRAKTARCRPDCRLRRRDRGSVRSCNLLTASQVSARIALIVLYKTDFFGLHPDRSRAKARKEAESSR